MIIDIDRFTEEELIALNHQIVARIRYLRESRTHSVMLEFKIGDHVAFQPDGLSMKVGVLTRYNKKSVTVITNTGERWNVAPSLLWKEEKDAESGDSESNVVELFKRGS